MLVNSGSRSSGNPHHDFPIPTMPRICTTFQQCHLALVARDSVAGPEDSGPEPTVTMRHRWCWLPWKTSMFLLTRVRVQIHTDPTLEFFALDQGEISDAMLRLSPAIKPQHWVRGTSQNILYLRDVGPSSPRFPAYGPKYLPWAPGAVRGKRDWARPPLGGKPLTGWPR